ncbi:hypothetical protein DFJ73DRAFT_781283 [Zopfochytrium polystomum]|nr:hypothetical protein DFJ73DRAFT_781283 [Zopfochytrium polystomum]
MTTAQASSSSATAAAAVATLHDQQLAELGRLADLTPSSMATAGSLAAFPPADRRGGKNKTKAVGGAPSALEEAVDRLSRKVQTELALAHIAIGTKPIEEVKREFHRSAVPSTPAPTADPYTIAGLHDGSRPPSSLASDSPVLLRSSHPAGPPPSLSPVFHASALGGGTGSASPRRSNTLRSPGGPTSGGGGGGAGGGVGVGGGGSRKVSTAGRGAPV